MSVQIFINKDLFQHVFFYIVKLNFIGNIHEFNLICKGVEVTKQLWINCFCRLEMKIPKFKISKIEIWMNLINIEFFTRKKVNTCIECIQWFKSDEFAMGKDYGEKYFYMAPGYDGLYFDITQFNPEIIGELECLSSKEPALDTNEHRFEKILTYWNMLMYHQKIFREDDHFLIPGPQCIITWAKEITVCDRYTMSGSSSCYCCDFQYYDMDEDLHTNVIFMSESDCKKLLKILLSNNMHPYNNVSSKLIFNK